MMNKVAVVFVHGIFGNPETSWGSTSAFLTTDVELKEQFSTDFFRYPAGLSAWIPFVKYIPWVRKWSLLRRAIRIQDVALGLGTHIDTVHGKSTPPVLIGHSMGGLVIRQYLLNQFEQGTQDRIKSVLLFAVPNKGANLAALAERLDLTSRQILQLAPNSDYLENLNRRWSDKKIDSLVDISCVAALLDGVVEKESALLSTGPGRAHYLHEEGHISCTKPNSIDSVSYQLIRTAIVNGINQTAKPVAGAPDPLFFMYNLQCEPYYIEREIDKAVGKQIDHGVWVHGPSGVGKTNCLLRNALFRNHRIVYVSTANHKGAGSVQEAMRSLVTQIAHRATGDSSILPPDKGDATGWMVDLLRQKLDTDKLTIILDEIPNDACVLVSIARLVMAAVQVEKLNGQMSVRFALSSLLSPADVLPMDEGRILEVVRPAPMKKWVSEDMRRLVDRLCHSTSIRITSEDVERICFVCDGDPRYVKNIFRELNLNNEMGLERALATVHMEQVHSRRMFVADGK